jgi:transcriptional regulator of arginine metabolism
MAMRVKRSTPGTAGTAEAVMAERKVPTRLTVAGDSADAARVDEAGRLAKPQRQHRIARLLEEHAVSSQGQLVELLAGDGVVATQATVSRDLEDMGAVKVRVPGGELVYAIPELPTAQFAPEDHLRRVFSDWVVDVAHSLNIVVLRTPPGSAHVVASALDRARLDEMVGTVAGDDTILVIAAESIGGAALAERLRQLAGLAG